ncbi:MAG TPA: sialidase family protein [Acidiferrobacterales bacterium]|nr:sialidase family protein [Acidiferrobacterales bacterium]
MTARTAADLRRAAQADRWLRAALLVAAVLVFGGLYARLFTASLPGGFVSRQAVARAIPVAAPFYRAQLLPNAAARSVHSATAAEISGGRLRAFWYGGSREGASDVAIYTSVYAPGPRTWSPAHVVITREAAQRHLQRYVRKLGNPVVGRDRSGRLWLFFVSVSVGGWSGSAINLMVSEDEGETWSPPRRLIASPFLNISTLVKGAPLQFADGAIGLPVYHEMLGKFGELLRLDAEGHAIQKSRLSWGRSSLQPVIVPWSKTEAVGFMRYSGEPPGRILMVRTTDAGRHWSPPVKTVLPNPNAALGGVLLTNGGLLLAFNNSQDNRDDLSLAYSADYGNTWQIAYRLEGGSTSPQAPSREYSYPWIMQDRAGDVHLLYTWGRSHIKHVHFNLAWLERRR